LKAHGDGIRCHLAHFAHWPGQALQLTAIAQLVDGNVAVGVAEGEALQGGVHRVRRIGQRKPMELFGHFQIRERQASDGFVAQFEGRSDTRGFAQGGERLLAATHLAAQAERAGLGQARFP
jgi:hypothetical protein